MSEVVVGWYLVGWLDDRIVYRGSIDFQPSNSIRILLYQGVPIYRDVLSIIFGMYPSAVANG